MIYAVIYHYFFLLNIIVTLSQVMRFTVCKHAQ